MNLINMLPWYLWVIFSLVPPLIFLLYFLKLRRVPLEVPSTYLWMKTVEDLHVNSIWQRLRRNLLLLLQIIAVLLLMASVLRPGCEGTQLAGERFIFIVDQSSSMSATDTESGKSRLEEAKTQISEMLRDMQSDEAAMLISFSDEAIVQQSYTRNKELLKRKVQSIQQTQRASDISEALNAASGLANPGRTSDKQSERDVQVAEALDATLFIFSDGQFKEVPKFIFGNLNAEYRPIGSFNKRPENVGITAFSINDRVTGEEKVQLFARLLNSGDKDQDVDLALYVNNELQDARTVVVPGRGEKDIAGRNSGPLSFDLSNFATGLESPVPIRLEIENEDIYPIDNVAHAVLNPANLANVLVISDYPKYLRFAMGTEFIEKVSNIEFENRSILEDEDFKKDSVLGAYDLIIFDQCQPETMPSCNTIFWGSLPPEDRWELVDEAETLPIVDFNNNHPILFDVPMGNVNIVEGLVHRVPKGGILLVESLKGSIMSVAPRGGFEDLVIGFPLVTYEADGDISINTDWPRNLGFPVFIQNLMLNLGTRFSFAKSINQSPGQLVKIRTQFPYEAIDVTNPAGDQTNVKLRSDNSYIYSNAKTIGVYDIVGEGQSETSQMFAVNLLDSRESNLEVVDELKLGYEELKGKTERQPSRKDFWRWILVAVLVVTTIEWIIYNRRIFI
ncbi:MAG: BatA and WFA domain-containing protein [Planctomycetota bacterium]